jgi:hypothetical protein
MRNKIEKWEKLRAKGKWNFILKYGVLLWGVGTAVLFSLFFPMVMGGKGQSSSVFALSIVLFPIGGIAWGYFMWMFSENAYMNAKLTEQRHAADSR